MVGGKETTVVACTEKAYHLAQSRRAIHVVFIAGRVDVIPELLSRRCPVLLANALASGLEKFGVDDLGGIQALCHGQRRKFFSFEEKLELGLAILARKELEEPVGASHTAQGQAR